MALSNPESRFAAWESDNRAAPRSGEDCDPAAYRTGGGWNPVVNGTLCSGTGEAALDRLRRIQQGGARRWLPTATAQEVPAPARARRRAVPRPSTPWSPTASGGSG